MSSPAYGSSRPFEFARAFTFAFEDPDWIKKIAIGGVFTLLSSLIIGIFFVVGYMVRVIRNVANGAPRPLPEWDDLGGIFNDGLAPVGAYLAYGLGVALLISPFFCMMAFVGPMLGGEDGGAMAGMMIAVGAIAFYGAIFLLSLGLWFWMPAAMLRVSLQGRFGAAFEFSEILAFIKRHFVSYLMTLAAMLVAGFVAQFGVILCCVGLFATSFLANCVLAFNLGELARIDAGR
ncbi:MAG: DUF4013 domain-containing protein [Vicinamibacteria bacterium]|nr:DUF4013 domain-containing protein [Vicinamibacteria bacterium]